MSETQDGAIEAPKVSLTGDQVKFIRTVLDESQGAFGRRFAVSQPAIHRIEQKRDEKVTGPLVILIADLARDKGIAVPEQPDLGTADPQPA